MKPQSDSGFHHLPHHITRTSTFHHEKRGRSRNHVDELLGFYGGHKWCLPRAELADRESRLGRMLLGLAWLSWCGLLACS